MIARMRGHGYEPRHKRQRGRYRDAEDLKPSAGLYGLCLVAIVAALTWPLPAGVVA